MEEKKKKKLTLGVSSKTSHNVPNYVKSRKKMFIRIKFDFIFINTLF